ncbi:MAG: DUF4976 domain-containing protein, partial [Bacteroidales bacterium]
YMDLQRMVRKDGFKLIIYPDADKILLFDIENDPREMIDLSDDPDYQDIKAGLFIDLLNLQKEMNDNLDLTMNILQEKTVK